MKGEVLLTRRSDMITLATGQTLRFDKPLATPDKPWGTQVTDLETDEPVLWPRGGHFNRVPDAYLLFPGRRCLVFLVTGPRAGNAVMTAVTETGETALLFRQWNPDLYQVVVSPGCDLTAQILCAIDMAAPWLGWYFATPSST